MNARYPNPPLNQFVEMIWLMPGRQGGNSPEMALPTGTVELVIDLDFEQTRGFVGCDSNTPVMFRGPIVCGVHTRPFLIDTAKSGRTVGVHFKPGGAAGIFPVLSTKPRTFRLNWKRLQRPCRDSYRICFTRQATTISWCWKPWRHSSPG